MNSWEAEYEKKKLLVLDGAWGTELARHGLPAGVAPETWNLERPDEVRAVASAYVEAGADIILTNTFGGNRLKLADAGIEADVTAINRAGAEISRRAAADGALVFASMGPTGRFMAPLGTVTEAEMIACFQEQARPLLAGGADAILIETMTDLGEAKAALHGAREAGAEVVAVSMTYDRGPAGYATMMGVKPVQATKEFDAAGADIVGANCGAGVDNMVEIVAAVRRATERPIWAKPNAGLPELVNGETVFREGPEEMAGKAHLLIEAGATHVGGCCGSTPDHIRLIAEVVRRIRREG